MTTDPLGAADEQARQKWEDGDGATVATSSGIWHAAIAYERARLAKPPTPPGTRPTPRTDAELARLLLDFDLTNIDRREAMAEFARLLEGEIDDLKAQVAAREAAGLTAPPDVAGFVGDDLLLPCTGGELAAWKKAAEKGGYINLRAWVIDTLTKGAPPHA